jgi:hypothetical protein
MAVYPYEKTNPIVLQVTDGVTSVDSALFKKYSDTILRLENELGIKPSGTYSDVRTRLDAMEVKAGGDGYGAGSPHSTQIATHFRHNWLNPTISIPSGSTTMSTVVGQVPVNPPFEAGYNDGYGISYFINRFYVDQDVSLTLSLYETTSTPTLVSSNTYSSGEHTVSTIVALPFATSLLRNYELRCSQVASGGTTNTNSIIWNSRFLFVPTNISDTSRNNFYYITADFDFSDGYTKVIGTIPASSAVQDVALTITTPFDGYTTISVGDDLDNTRLMDTTDNIPSVSDTYLADSNYIYTNDTQVNLYMTGSPTVGQGTVIVYFH